MSREDFVQPLRPRQPLDGGPYHHRRRTPFNEPVPHHARQHPRPSLAITSGSQRGFSQIAKTLKGVVMPQPIQRAGCLVSTRRLSRRSPRSMAGFPAAAVELRMRRRGCRVEWRSECEVGTVDCVQSPEYSGFVTSLDAREFDLMRRPPIARQTIARQTELRL